MGRRALAIAGLAFVAVGCDDPLKAPVQQAPRASAAAALAQSKRIGRPDQERLEIGREIPGYAGHWWDESGNLHVALKNLQQSDRAVARFTPKVQSRPRAKNPKPSGSPRVIVERVKYSFAELYQYRQVASAIVPRIPKTVFVGNDLMNNRIRVGVRDAAAGETVHSALVEAGIPPDAISVVIEPNSSRTQSSGTIGQTRSTIEGGLATVIVHWPGGQYTDEHYCTIGIVGLVDERPQVLTNSHCTGSLDGVKPNTFMYQADPDIDGNYIGDEFTDLRWYDYTLDGDCPEAGASNMPPLSDPNAEWVCRYSDAALFSINQGVSYRLGSIARTLSRETGAGVHGSKTINSANPHLTVAFMQYWAELGESVNKIGNTTGWTYGNVTDDCVDAWDESPEENYFLYCQQEVSNSADERGDSGAPVFIMEEGFSSNNVGLVGIAWGKTNTGFRFSTWNDIISEVGAITF